MQLSALAPHQSSWDLPHWPNMAIAPVRLKINTASEIEREPREERVMEEEDCGKMRDSDTESVKGGVGGEQDQLGNVVHILFIWVYDSSGVPDKLVLSHRCSHIFDTTPLYLDISLIWLSILKDFIVQLLSKLFSALLKLAVNVLTLKIGRKIGLSKPWSTYTAL